MHNVFSPDTGPAFLGFAMCGASALTTYQQSTSSVGASRVNLIVRRGGGEAQPTNVISGPNMLDSFASLDPDGCWRKTSQGYSQLTLDGSLEAFSGIWPRSGTMQSGQCYPRAPWVLHTHESACSLWPTPMAQEGTGGGSAAEAQRILDKIPRPSGHLGQLRLKDLWKLQSNKAPFSVAFVEALMGFPLGWCSLED